MCRKKNCQTRTNVFLLAREEEGVKKEVGEWVDGGSTAIISQ